MRSIDILRMRNTGGATSTSTVTIASGTVASNLSDFPVYVKLADMSSGFWSAVTSDGGNIRVKQSGSDIPFDVVVIDTSGQTGTLFFKASSLLTGSSNVFTVTTAAGLTMPAVGASNGRNAVWSAFDWAFLCENATTFIDRTGGANGVKTGVPTYTATSIALGAGCGLLPAGDTAVDFASRTSRSVFTLGATGNCNLSGLSGNSVLTEYSPNNASRGAGMGLRFFGTNSWNLWDNVNGWIVANSTKTLVQNQSRRIHAVYNGSTNRKFYVDGVIEVTSGAITAQSTGASYRAGASTGVSEFFKGSIAYFYARPQALTADYLAAEFLNLNAPTSFYAIT